MRKAVAVPLPDGVFRIRKPSGREYWYHQARRGSRDPGPITRLPGGPADPDFWTAAARLAATTPEAGTIDALIAAYKAGPDWTRHREGTRDTYAVALRHIAGRWGPLQVGGITAVHIRRFLDDEFAARRSMGNLTLAVLKKLLAWGVERGVGVRNPAREVSAFDLDEENVRPWPDALHAHCRETAPEPLRRLAVLGRATGQRVVDLVRMRPADRDGAGIALRIAKGRDREHWCPLRQAELREIDGWDCPPMTPYIFDGRAFLTTRIQTLFRRWIDAIPAQVWQQIAPQLAREAARIHGLRATAVCDGRIAGYTHQEIAIRIDMSIAMVERYSRHIDKRLAAGAERKRKTR